MLQTRKAFSARQAWLTAVVILASCTSTSTTPTSPPATVATAPTAESSLPEQPVVTVESGTTVPLSECRGPQSTEWGQSAIECNGSLDDYNYMCPPGGQAYTVWGTDIYTHDSSVCTAAVHAGLINFEDGGEVVIEMRSGESSYLGTTANGVTTMSYGSWGRSFVFDESTVSTLTWEHVGPESDEAMIGEIVPAVIVGSGDVYLAADDFTGGGGLTWTSNDGVEWKEGTPGLTAVPGVAGGFLAYHDVGYDGPGGLGFWRSDDGMDWSDAPSSAEGTTVARFTWSGVTVDEVLAMQLPRLSSSDLYEAGTVFEVNDRFVAYYWSPTESVEAAVSNDGQTWEKVEVPDFLAEWFDFDSPRAMSDRGLSHRMWSGTFSAGHGTVLAITADGEGHHIWQSSDGVSWEEKALTLPDRLMGSAVHATHHLTAMTTGWSLTPWDLPGATVAYHSADGRAWQPLAPARSAMIRPTDDKVFFFSYGADDGWRVRGLDIATLEK